MADILVTGTGFLGTNIILQLVEQGFSVRAFTLAGSETKYIDVPHVEVVFGDITDFSDLTQHMQGVDYVIHTAGDTTWWKKFVPRQRRINIQGVENVMQAALDNKVKKVVHTSTASTLGYNPDGLTNEEWGHFNIGQGPLRYRYAISKRMGEKIALFYAQNGLDVCVINPGAIIGPYDHTLQFGRIFLNIRDGKLPGMPCGGQSWAHVTEVAKSHIRAIDRGKSGEKYICGGANATYQEIFEEIARSIDATPPKRVLSRRTAVTLGYLNEFLAFFTQRPPQLNPGKAEWMSQYPKYDSSKAIAELGYQVTTVHQMVEDARDWYIQNGFL